MSDDKKQVYKIKINYKSGNSVVFWANSFSSKFERGVLKEINYSVATDLPWIRNELISTPLFIGVNDIESIWQLEIVEI